LDARRHEPAPLYRIGKDAFDIGSFTLHRLGVLVVFGLIGLRLEWSHVGPKSLRTWRRRWPSSSRASAPFIQAVFSSCFQLRPLEIA
jgi:cytochrome b